MYTDRFFYVKFINIHWIVFVGMGRLRLLVGGGRNISVLEIQIKQMWGLI